MVEDVPGNGLNGIVKTGHCFGPFDEVVNHDDNILMVVIGGGATFHEVNAQFAEWAAVMIGCNGVGGVAVLDA